jgi:hypothetical protein
LARFGGISSCCRLDYGHRRLKLIKIRRESLSIGQTTYANKYWYDLTGIPLSNVEECLSKEELEGANIAFQRATIMKQEFEYQLKIRVKDPHVSVLKISRIFLC